VARDSLRIFNDTFGVYPYAELDVIQAPMENASGVEFPGLILITRSYYSGDRQEFFSSTVAHEVAHQWWYNLVGNDVFDHPWQDEALATYSSALYWEATQGLDGYKGMMDYYQGQYDKYLQEHKDDVITRSLIYYESRGDEGGYGIIVYRKGALFFQALREEIGDEAFFSALRSYFESCKYRIAAPQDLLEAFEAAAGRQLDDFYQEWLYSAKP
jgi:aminopeptidase N